MINKYFKDEKIQQNDLFFMCSMIERVARKIYQRNKYVVNVLGYENLYHLISLANVLHCENPDKVVDDWINEYHLKKGTFNIKDVDKELCAIIPTPLDMGKVYMMITFSILPVIVVYLILSKHIVGGVAMGSVKG